jgi:hypothetical protein
MNRWPGTGKEKLWRGKHGRCYRTGAAPVESGDNCATLFHMLETVAGCFKWAAVGFVVAYFLMKLYEASHIHDDIPKPEFKIRQSRRAALVLSTFAGMLSALVWLLVQNWD